jgi:serine/threonine-protein kinase
MAKYTPIFELGRGGMATVFLAVVKGPGGFNKLQVVKQLRSELVGENEFTTMFLDEARLSARINHPNVVQTNEVACEGNRYFIAMEYLEGQSFDQVARRAGDGLTLMMHIRILCDTLEGLGYAHDLKDFAGRPLNVVHRDVSPQNIFVTYDGQVKLLDFGIAKAADASTETRAGVLKGKFAYMAPEQITSKAVDRRADIFAVGALLWRALTGKRLWRGMHELEVLRNVAQGNIPSPDSVQPGLPPELVAICNRAMARDPAQRYQTALELRGALDEYCEKAGDRTTARDIGRYVASLFEDRRKAIATAIEARLSEVNTVVDASPELWESGSVARLTVAPGPSAGSLPPGALLHDSARALSPESVSSGSLPLAAPSSGALASANRAVPPLTAQTLNSQSLNSQLSETKAIEASTLPASPAPTFPSNWRKPGIAALGIAVACGVALLLRAGLTREHEARPVETQAVSTPLPSPGLPAEAAPRTQQQQTVGLRIKVTPPNSRISIDAHELGPSDRFPMDGATHAVRADATGYEPSIVYASFDRPVVELVFNLNRKKPDTFAVAPPHAAPTPKPTAETIPPVVAPAPKPTAPELPTDVVVPSRKKPDETDPWRTRNDSR